MHARLRRARLPEDDEEALWRSGGRSDVRRSGGAGCGRCILAELQARYSFHDAGTLKTRQDRLPAARAEPAVVQASAPGAADIQGTLSSALWKSLQRVDGCMAPRQRQAHPLYGNVVDLLDEVREARLLGQEQVCGATGFRGAVRQGGALLSHRRAISRRSRSRRCTPPSARRRWDRRQMRRTSNRLNERSY